MPDEEQQSDQLTQFIQRIVGILRRGNADEAGILLEMHINRAEGAGHTPHPLVFILYALSCQMQRRDLKRSTDAFERVLMHEGHPTYRAIATLGTAMFGKADNDAAVLNALKQALRYAGRHHSLVQALVGWLLATRFAGKAEFQAILEQKPLPYRESDSLLEAYPRTASLLRR